MEEKRKSRNIPLQEYIPILQLEYLSYKVRSELYEAPFNEKYREFCKKKEETIRSFALKMGRPCIFTSKSLLDKYLADFFGDGFGLPNFKYRDEYQRQSISHFDRKCYFKEGDKIEYQGEEYLVSRNLCKKDSDVFNISIQQQGKPWKIVDINELKRIDYLKLI